MKRISFFLVCLSFTVSAQNHLRNLHNDFITDAERLQGHSFALHRWVCEPSQLTQLADFMKTQRENLSAVKGNTRNRDVTESLKTWASESHVDLRFRRANLIENHQKQTLVLVPENGGNEVVIEVSQYTTTNDWAPTPTISYGMKIDTRIGRHSGSPICSDLVLKEVSSKLN
jgi:hypothetical protein